MVDSSVTRGRQNDDWDFVYRPRKLFRWVAIAIGIVLVIHITFGLLLTIEDTGPRNIGLDDQAALILIGLLLSALLLLLTRARLRVGPRGIGVRNMVGEKVYGWERTRGLTYPDKGFGAHLLFPNDEYVTVLAVQAGDGDRAVAAMARYRELERQYRPGVGDPY